MLCSTSHFPKSGRQKRAAEEVIRNVATKRARTLCSGHIRPLTTHFDASLLSSEFLTAASPWFFRVDLNECISILNK
jgi:hypothetical protein